MPFDQQDYQPAPVITDPVARVLWDAARYIREHGWCQNALDTADGRVCLQGAIMAVDKSPRHEGFLPANNAVCLYLRTSLTWEWNDDPARTSSEVISALEGCARELQGRARSQRQEDE